MYERNWFLYEVKTPPSTLLTLKGGSCFPSLPLRQLWACSVLFQLYQRDEWQKVSVSVEQRIIIKFISAEGVQPLEILQMIEKQFGVACLSGTRVFECCKTFRDGKEWVENTSHNRRPPTSITPSHNDCAKVLVYLQDCRTINAEYYSNILLGGVKDKFRSKRKTGENRMSFLQNNARPHTARKIMVK